MVLITGSFGASQNHFGPIFRPREISRNREDFNKLREQKMNSLWMNSINSSEYGNKCSFLNWFTYLLSFQIGCQLQQERTHDNIAFSQARQCLGCYKRLKTLIKMLAHLNKMFLQLKILTYWIRILFGYSSNTWFSLCNIATFIFVSISDALKNRSCIGIAASCHWVLKPDDN